MCKISLYYFIVTMLLVLPGCEKFAEIDLPQTVVSTETVFSSDLTATSAVTGIYADMTAGGFAGGTDQSIAAFAGLSADELKYNRAVPDYLQFGLNNIAPTNGYLEAFWNSFYKTIYQANAVLEGLNTYSGVTEPVKKQLRGEALFVRGFTHFYLYNLFGNIPVALTTDYKKNAVLPRSDSATVYGQIIKDLTEAKTLLSENYPTLDDDYFTPARIRPNRSVASAMLARVYLYQQNWEAAEAEATAVINDDKYLLPDNLSEVFLKNSTETIWALRPVTDGGLGRTSEAFYFSLNFRFFNSLTTSLGQDFEANDKRKNEWVGIFTPDNIDTTYYAYKYKQTDPSIPPTEYSMVMRLAEQYLIRAEARAHQQNLLGAIEDIDKIRNRAGLTLINDTDPSADEQELLMIIEKERRNELFTEWGHRWFDLKRTGRATAVLATIKDNWSASDLIYPIPQVELDKNPNLK